MNQGKLEVVKQEMARANVNILGISKQNEMEWVNLTQMTIISTIVGKNPLEKWSSHHGQQKSPKCSTWMRFQNDRMISVRFQGKPFNIMVIQVYAPTSNAE